MPWDFRIMLGFQGPEAIAQAAREMGLVLVDTDGEAIETPDERLAGVAFTDPKRAAGLLRAYKVAVTALGGRVEEVAERYWQDSMDGRSVRVHLDGKVQKANSFSLYSYFSSESKDTLDDMVLGVALDERYHRVLLDLHPMGLSDTRNLDACAGRVALARTALAAEFPAFQDAHLIVKMMFY